MKPLSFYVSEEALHNKVFSRLGVRCEIWDGKNVYSFVGMLLHPPPIESPSSSRKHIAKEVLNLVLKQFKEIVLFAQTTLQAFIPLIGSIPPSSVVHVGIPLSIHILGELLVSFSTIDPTSIAKLTVSISFDFTTLYPLKY